MKTTRCAAAMAAAATLILAGCITAGPQATSTSSPPMGVLIDGYGDSISGMVRAVDGDTLTIHGIKVDLIAIDAPPLKQDYVSTGAARTVIPCGEWAQDALRKAIQMGRTRCKIVGTKPGGAMGRLFGFCAVEMERDRHRLADMTISSDDSDLQKQFDIFEAELAETRGFRSVDPERGTLSMDLGMMMVRSGLAESVPESIAHLPFAIRDAADYSHMVPGYEMTDEERHIIERWGAKGQ